MKLISSSMRRSAERQEEVPYVGHVQSKEENPENIRAV